VYPTTQQATTLTQWLTTCRVLYNNALAERKDAWQTHQQSVTYYEQATQLQVAKKTNPFLKAVHSQVLQDLKGNTGMIPSLTRKVGSHSITTRRNSGSRKLEGSTLNYIALSHLKELSRPVLLNAMSTTGMPALQ